MSAAVLAGWLFIGAGLGAAGVFQAAAGRVFPSILLALIVTIGGGILLLRQSTVLQAVIDALPVSWLTGIQFYRVFGGVFLGLYLIDRMPGEFAIPAGAGDVAIGLAAPVMAWLFHARAQGSGLGVLGWNLLGVLDLVVAVAMGFLTAPGPLQVLALESSNALITSWPLVLVPVFAVPLSILLHLAVFRRLKSEMADESRRERARDARDEGWISRLITT
jgi:hypothetical protein